MPSPTVRAVCLASFVLATARPCGAQRAADPPPPRATVAPRTATAAVARVVPNDNRTPAGATRGDTLRVALVARVGDWHPDGDAGPGAPMPAFAESDGAPRIPGPLVRARAGTVAAVTVRNTLPDTLRVHGLHDRPLAGAPDPAPGTAPGTAPFILAPGAARTVHLRLDAPGTYLYWGTTTRRALAFRTGQDAQLSGALVVDDARDDPARPRDRVLVLGMWTDTVHRAGTHRQRVLGVVNGRAWPHTERLTHTLGDTVRWRVVNASADLHPMHLHGFYFRVMARGDGVRDTVHAAGDGAPAGSPAGDLAVTESLTTGQTVRLEWVPERAGNWLFHCHIPEHFAPRGSLGTPRPPGATHDHGQGGMSGLVVGVAVQDAPARVVVASAGATTVRRPRAAGAERRFRLLVREHVRSTAAVPRFGYALHERGAEPPPDTGSVSAPVLDLVRGEPVRITVVNRLREPTAVHWHGIELASYYDGVPGFSGTPARPTPLVAPGDSFVVRFTPPRAGTFIYHTHADEVRQQTAGLAGALVVREPGTRRDPATDLPIIVLAPPDSARSWRMALLNGRQSPLPLTMRVGRTYRLRLVHMHVPRAGMTMELRGGDTLVRWQPVAKDGAELPRAARASRPATVFLGVGETVDVEVAPAAPGALRLEVRFGIPPGARPGGTPGPGGTPARTAAQLGPVIVAATWPIHVVGDGPAAGSPPTGGRVRRKGG